MAQCLTVGIKTNPFSQRDKQYTNSITIQLPQPSDFTGHFLAAASHALKRIFKPGYQYKKVGIMLASGYFRPLVDAWSYERRDLVDLTPWRYAIPVAFTLFSAVAFLYLLFSPIGLVGGVSRLFVPLISALGVANVAFWWHCIRRHSTASVVSAND